MNQTEWVTPCNPKIYDLESEFSVNDYVYWRQNANYEIGDIVYIYLSSGRNRIRYKTIVTDVNINADDIEENYWNDPSQKSRNKKRVRLQLIREFNDIRLSYSFLKSNGLTSTIQGAIRLKGKWADYIHKIESEHK